MPGAGLAGAASFSVPFLMAFMFIRNAFYHYGTSFLDAGWFAELMWDGDWGLDNPSVVLVTPDFPPRSFYSIHFSPMLEIVSLVRQLSPLDRVDVFACYMGLAHGLLGLFMFYVLVRLKAGIAWSIVAACLGVAFGVNGLAANVTTYPHIELLAPGLALFALVFLMERRLVPAWTFGTLALLVREDIGFHIVAVLGLVLIVEIAHSRSIRPHRSVIIFAAACLAYSVAAMAAQRLFFPSVGSFEWVYAGDPPFSHLSGGLIGRRLAFLFTDREYLCWSFGLTLLVAAMMRSISVAIGALAFLPWLGLQLSASSSAPATMSIHYAFPLIVGIGWTAIALTRLERSPYVLAACVGAVVASTYVANPQVGAFFENIEPHGFARSPGATVRFADALPGSLPLLGSVKVDAAVMALAPRGLSPEAWLGPQDWKDGKPAAEVDTVIYFEHGSERSKVDAQVEAMGRVSRFSVPGTNIRIVTRRPINPRAAIAPLVRAER